MNKITNKILKRYGFASKKTKLSIASDLQQALDTYSPDSNNFREVEDAALAGSEFEDALTMLDNSMADFDDQFRYIEENYGDIEDTIETMQERLDAYIDAADELGLDLSTNELYNDAKDLITDTQSLADEVQLFFDDYSEAYERLQYYK